MRKVHFNAVFSKVWSKAVTSCNVVAGFRKAGIHPFNDKAIAIPVNGEAVSHHIAESCGREPSTEMIDLPSTQTIDDRGSIEATSFRETETTENSFTPVEVQLYQHRIEEGYDVFTDQRYVQWVKLNHPALLPASLSQHQISSPLIETANENHIESSDDLVISTLPSSLSQPPSFQQLIEENGGNRLQQPQSPAGPFIEMMAEEHMGPSEEQPSTSECQPPSHDSPVEENKISKYLTLPDIPIKPTNKATTSTHQTGARIVTSQQFLREKEEKKKQLEGEKRLRKLERERKRNYKNRQYRKERRKDY